MPKIIFDEKERNYIEFRQVKDGIAIIMSAKDPDNNRKNRINSVKVSQEQFKELIKDFL